MSETKNINRVGAMRQRNLVEKKIDVHLQGSKKKKAQTHEKDCQVETHPTDRYLANERDAHQTS